MECQDNLVCKIFTPVRDVAVVVDAAVVVVVDIDVVVVGYEQPLGQLEATAACRAIHAADSVGGAGGFDPDAVPAVPRVLGVPDANSDNDAGDQK